MIQHQGIWLPDGEAHLVDWMTKAGEMVDGKGTYQIKKLRAALKYCKGWRTAVDVGAHVGMFSMQLVKKFERVYAFEPVEAHRECFLRNVDEYISRVGIFPFALGEKKQMVHIHTAPTSSGDSWVDGAGGVEMYTLDSFKLQDVDFIKIDCEGYEYFVLKGAEETIKRCRPCIIVEQKTDMCEKFGLKKLSAVTYLESLGAVRREEISGDYILSFP